MPRRVEIRRVHWCGWLTFVNCVVLGCRYAETFDYVTGKETTWILRRDLKPGSSTGRIYMAVDGTIVVR
jgi:hypothetical protein